ncbi:hypothetical protein [Listeria swaminathanii]|uniref:Uncharacterized protein n=1 Tax=Listeria swaminathanii TaxID=2713501 RepID=A0A7X1DNX9_9LIST|nr:hypothetical protein [Listeria swaminathanii]MBC2330611.1 hypothetical protein [Listeria swaminathanii]
MRKLLKNKKFWIVLVMLLVLIVVLLLVLQKCAHDEKETKPLEVEQDFKRNYAKWSDLKLNGDICNPTYLAELREMEKDFQTIYADAKKAKVWAGLSKKDQTIYTAYGDVGSELKTMNDAIEAQEYKQAQQVLTKILEIEKGVKQ